MANVAQATAFFDQLKKRRKIRCAVCNAEKPQFCNGCDSSAYCSKKCQKFDWPLHKILCKTFKLFQVLRPGKNTIGILFPVDEETPRLVWISSIPRSENKQDHPRLISLFLTADKILGHLLGTTTKEEEDSIETQFKIARNFDLIHNLIHNLILTYRKDCETQPVNKCILKLTNGKIGDYWKGPMVVTRAMILEDTSTEPSALGTAIKMARREQVEDMSLADLRHAVDVLTAFPSVQKKYAEGIRS